MLMECLIQRDGSTLVPHAGVQFEFASHPELTNGDATAKVCEVCADHAIKRFLGLKGLYQEYKVKPSTPEKAEPRAPAKPKEPPAHLTAEGFFILKNVQEVKRAIRMCEDRELLNLLGSQEYESPTRRKWVLEALDERLKDLADKNLSPDLLEAI